jgi:shikimate dehydrogenase
VRRRVVLIGDPVAHSVSPPMHRAGFNAARMDWDYEPLRVGRDEFDGVWEALRADRSVAGLNVTIPLKELVGLRVDRCEAEAGSVNTVVFEDVGAERVAVGHSTDGAGFLAAVRRVDGRPRRRAVVLGTGGAARAVAAALRAEGSAVTVLGRNRSAGERLALEVGARFEPWDPAAADHRGILVEALRHADLLANATPIGTGDPSASPVPDHAVPSPEVTVIDLVYRPRRTALLTRAAAAGCRTVEGIEMLIEQGARSFELWTGLPAPLETMRAAAYEALARDDGSRN